MKINNKIMNDYFNYLTVIKARSEHTIIEFSTDLRLLFMSVFKQRNPSVETESDCSFADIDFIIVYSLDKNKQDAVYYYFAWVLEAA